MEGLEWGGDGLGSEGWDLSGGWVELFGVDLLVLGVVCLKDMICSGFLYWDLWILVILLFDFVIDKTIILFNLYVYYCKILMLFFRISIDSNKYLRNV